MCVFEFSLPLCLHKKKVHHNALKVLSQDDDDKDDDKDDASKREERICARAESGVDEDIQRREKGNHARGEREFVAHD